MPRRKRAEIARRLQVSDSTLERYITKYRRNGAAGLRRKPRNDRGASRAVPKAWIKFALATFFLKDTPSTYRATHREIVRRCARRSIKAPSYSWVRARIGAAFRKASTRIQKIGDFERMKGKNKCTKRKSPYGDHLTQGNGPKRANLVEVA